MTVLITILLLAGVAEAIWPPGYSVNLTQEGTFVISEDIRSDTDDVYNDDDEMIKPRELERFGLQAHAAKFYRIHKMVRQHNEVFSDKPGIAADNVKPAESNFDREEPLPWEAGFVDEKGDFIDRVTSNRLLFAAAETLICRTGMCCI